MARRLTAFALASLALHAAGAAWVRAPPSAGRSGSSRPGPSPRVLPDPDHSPVDVTVDVEPKGVLSGESFDIPGARAPAPAAPSLDAVQGTRTDRAMTASAPVAATSARPADHSSPGDAPAAALFGALGDRGSVDLATAFGRGFSQAASADPTWLGAPLGDAGHVEVTLEIDATGRLVRASVGPGATPPLARGLRRAVALVEGRSFTSPSAVVVLRIAARVSPDTVHDHFEIGVADDGRGAHFVRPETHRRVDLDVGP